MRIALPLKRPASFPCFFSLLGNFRHGVIGGERHWRYSTGTDHSIERVQERSDGFIEVGVHVLDLLALRPERVSDEIGLEKLTPRKSVFAPFPSCIDSTNAPAIFAMYVSANGLCRH
ncbi:MAG: hypothetical protein QM736_13540 [Vicinamibacterales bacterium]